MKQTTSEYYCKAIDDIRTLTRTHTFSDTWIENVLVNKAWKMVGFQTIDDLCFILIGDRNWATRYTASSLTEAIRNETWYEVTKEEGNEIYKKILKSKKINKKGKEYYIWNFSKDEKCSQYKAVDYFTGSTIISTTQKEELNNAVKMWMLNNPDACIEIYKDNVMIYP